MNNMTKIGGACLLAFALASNAAAGESLQKMTDTVHPRVLVKKCDEKTLNAYDDALFFQVTSLMRDRDKVDGQKAIFRLAVAGIVPEAIEILSFEQFLSEARDRRKMTEAESNASFCKKVGEKSITLLEQIKKAGLMPPAP